MQTTSAPSLGRKSRPSPTESVSASDPVARVLAKLQSVRPSGDGWEARCPAHNDQRASLSIGRGDKGCVLNCHAGCKQETIVASVGLTMRDLFYRDGEHDNSRQPAKSYRYTDETGQLLYEVCRFEPKDFRQRRPDGAGGWVWNIKDTRRVLYRLHELQGKEAVFIVEGEKDGDRLWALGLPATTNSGGAGKWRAEYADQLKAAGCKRVAILPDNDPAGEAHGREVAQSCAQAGLTVWLIPLPGLPAKGDVSDWLAAGRTRDELKALAREAPQFDPHRKVSDRSPIHLTSLADLLSEPDSAIEWIVEGVIPAGNLVLYVTPPKTGKSTASRDLALSVARGDSWLGWRTTPGLVWLLSLEDKRSAVKQHFRLMGATGQEPLHVFTGQAPAELLATLQERAQRERPALIIVDTIARLIGVKDFNNYAEVSERFAPLIALARETGAALLLLHHASSHHAREGLDAVLGSTALSASVDNVLIQKRTDRYRVLSSVNRIGTDLEPTVIQLNPQTGRLERVGLKRQLDDRDLGARMLDVLAAESDPQPEAWIQQHIEGRRADKVRVLRQLFGMGRVSRQGSGGRKDPYRYSLPDSGSCDSNKPIQVPAKSGQELSETDTGLNLDFSIEVPEVPIRVREQELSNVGVRIPNLRTPSSPASESTFHVPEVPEVPAPIENNEFETTNPTKTPITTGLDSGSRVSRSVGYERI